MTVDLGIANRAMQVIGTRTNLTAAELVSNGSNEAIQLNLVYEPIRRQLLRMAPWNCAYNTVNLTLITAAPGTPENTSGATTLWQKGQPPPPWAYEYQYPVDCLFAAWVTPQTATGFAGGIPITTAVTGGAPSFWQGPPVRFRVGVDQFFGVVSAAVVNGGLGYAVGDSITLVGTTQGSPPIGAPAVLSVDAIGVGGTITAASPFTQVLGENGVGGSYFAKQANPVAQGSTSGSGTGATFNLVQQSPATNQRVILTNQEFAILNYIKDVQDVNIFDDLFLEAFVHALGDKICIALSGDKGLAQLAKAKVNEAIQIARRSDGNESLTVNDVTPSWLRARGINYIEDYSGPFNSGFDWGAMWPGYT